VKRLAAPFVEDRDLNLGQIVIYDSTKSEWVTLSAGADDTVLTADKGTDPGLKYVTRNTILDFASLPELVISDPAKAGGPDKIPIYDNTGSAYDWIARDNVTGGQIVWPGSTLLANEAALKVDTDNALGSANDRYLVEAKVAGVSKLQLWEGGDYLYLAGGIFTGGTAKSSAPDYKNYLDGISSGVITTVQRGAAVTFRFRPDATSSDITHKGLQLQAFWEASGTYTGSASLTGAEFEANVKQDNVTVPALIAGDFFTSAEVTYATGTTVTAPVAGRFQQKLSGTGLTVTAAECLQVLSPVRGSITFPNTGLRIYDQYAGTTSGSALRIDSQGYNNILTGNLKFLGADWKNGHLQLNLAHVWTDGTDVFCNETTPSTQTDGHNLNQLREYASFYEAGTTVLSGTAATIDLDTTMKNSNTSVFALATGEVTVSQTADFAIQYDFTADETGNNRDLVDVWLEENTGAGFVTVPGTSRRCYIRVTNDGNSCSARIIRAVASGNIYRIRAQRQGAIGVSSLADGSTLTFEQKER